MASNPQILENFRSHPPAVVWAFSRLCRCPDPRASDVLGSVSAFGDPVIRNFQSSREMPTLIVTQYGMVHSVMDVFTGRGAIQRSTESGVCVV